MDTFSLEICYTPTDMCTYKLMILTLEETKKKKGEGCGEREAKADYSSSNLLGVISEYLQ